MTTIFPKVGEPETFDDSFEVKATVRFYEIWQKVPRVIFKRVLKSKVERVSRG